MTAPVCLISGVGPGTGSALARRFAEGGYRVALLARSEERLAVLEKQLSNAKGYRCDVSDPAQVEAVVSAVERDLGNPSVVIHKLLAEHSAHSGRLIHHVKQACNIRGLCFQSRASQSTPAPTTAWPIRSFSFDAGRQAPWNSSAAC